MIKVLRGDFNRGFRLECDIGEYNFHLFWDDADNFWATEKHNWKIVCMKKPEKAEMEEADIKELVSAFKEAKAELGKEVEIIEEKIKPLIDYIASKNIFATP